jgi:hypothetical protein
MACFSSSYLQLSNVIDFTPYLKELAGSEDTPIVDT